MDSFFSDLVRELGDWGIRRIGRILEGHNFAAIATLLAGIATLCIALILIRGLDILGIAGLAIVAATVCFTVYLSIRRVMKVVRFQDRSSRG